MPLPQSHMLHERRASRLVPSAWRLTASVDNVHISAYSYRMRRKPGTLLPLEVAILEAALDLRERGEGEFHGYAVATQVAGASSARKLTAYGTLYRALGRLEKQGVLESHWENPATAEAESRPRRRLYSITGAGESALAHARQAARAAIKGRAERLEEGLTPT